MPSGFPVVIVEAGGVPVIQVDANAPLATVAENGLGMPITLVEANGIPLIIQEPEE